MPLTNVIEAFSSKPKYELSIHFACGAGTYIFEDQETRKFVPITKFCDIQGMLELFEDKSEEIRSGKNKYFTMLEVVRKLKSFVDTKKQPAGLDLAKMFGNILMKRSFDSVGSWHVKGLFLGMMHFQDKYNEDLERLQRCDIHYLTPDLRIIPFCAFNVITGVVPRPHSEKVLHYCRGMGGARGRKAGGRPVPWPDEARGRRRTGRRMRKVPDVPPGVPSRHVAKTA